MKDLPHGAAALPHHSDPDGRKRMAGQHVTGGYFRKDLGGQRGDARPGGVSNSKWVKCEEVAVE